MPSKCPLLIRSDVVIIGTRPANMLTELMGLIRDDRVNVGYDLRTRTVGGDSPLLID